MSATSAVSSAASLPTAPITMPTSAAASAGASLMPSPTIATLPHLARIALMASTLSCGSSSARTASTPTSRATRVAAPTPSPVSISIRATPPFLSRSITSRADSRGASASVT